MLTGIFVLDYLASSDTRGVSLRAINPNPDSYRD